MASVQCFPTLPRSGSMRNGTVYQRASSASRRSESGSSSWLTPVASLTNDGESVESFRERGRALRLAGSKNGNGAGTPLTIAAKAWPTPTARLGDDRRGVPSASTAQGRLDTGRRNLDDAVAAHWSTPTSTDAKASGSAGYSTESGRHAGTTLTDAAVRAQASAWPTPAARDWKGQDIPSRTGGASLGHAVQTGIFRHGPQDQQTETPGPPSSPGGRGSLPLWPTPTTDEATGYLSGANRDTWRPTLAGAVLGLTPELHSATRQRKPAGARLNPDFVDWLQGWPPGWSACAPLGTGSFRSWLQSHSCVLRRVLAST
jgi:hypothetical protein